MNRPRRIGLLIALVLIVSLLLLFAWCRGTGTHDGGDRLETTDAHTLYPGASFELAVTPASGRSFSTENGEIVTLSDPPTLVYVAPLTGESDTYEVFDGDGGGILAEGRVILSMPPASELADVLVDPGNGVEALYGEVRVSASLVDGAATARYEASDEADSLEISLEGNDGEITWNGVTFDGRGPLSEAEAKALHDLATGPLARAVTMAPLDLGCVDDAGEIPHEAFAALILPWQMILKYEVARRGPVVRHFLSESTCSFPGGAPDDSKTPHAAIFWDADHTVPATHFFFPLDGEGRMRAVAP